MINLKEIAKNKKIKKAPRLRGVKESKGAELQYLKLLKQLTRELKSDVTKNILPLLKTSKLTTDSVDDILIALANLSAKFANVLGFANSTSEIVVNNIEKINRKKFINNINSAIGIDLEHIIESENLSEIVALQKSKNVSLIKSIPQEFIKNIEIEIQNGIANGLRHEQIAKNINGIKGINSTFGKLENRIKTIARNETASINASISKKRSENLGITKGIWRTAMDSRVRGNPSGKYAHSKDNHYALEGVEFDLSKGAKDPRSGKMIYPGMEINCFTGSTKLNNSSDCSILYRRWYTGVLTVIRADNGSVFECTPNHPILTKRGYVPAYLINESDYIIELVDENINAIKGYRNCYKPSFEQIFKSFILGGVPLTVSSSTSGKFHGDVSDSNIDIISTDSFLMSKANSSLLEKITKLNFAISDMHLCWRLLTSQGRLAQFEFGSDFSSSRDMSVLDLIFSRLLIHLTPFECFCFTLGSWSDSIFDKTLIDNSTRNLEEFRDSIDAFSSLVFGEDFFKWQIDRLHHLVSRGIKPYLLKPLAENGGVAVDSDCSIFDNSALQHKTLSVNNVSHRDFSGHIYNLENKLHYYTIETSTNRNIIVSNCRCYFESIIE